MIIVISTTNNKIDWGMAIVNNNYVCSKSVRNKNSIKKVSAQNSMKKNPAKWWIQDGACLNNMTQLSYHMTSMIMPYCFCQRKIVRTNYISIYLVTFITIKYFWSYTQKKGGGALGKADIPSSNSRSQKVKEKSLWNKWC